MPFQLDLLEKKNFFSYNIFGSELADTGLQNNCVNKTEGCLSQRENGIVGFFSAHSLNCGWLPFWETQSFFSVWCEKKHISSCGIFFYFYDLSHVLMKHPVYYLMLIAAYCA